MEPFYKRQTVADDRHFGTSDNVICMQNALEYQVHFSFSHVVYVCVHHVNELHAAHNGADARVLTINCQKTFYE